MPRPIYLCGCLNRVAGVVVARVARVAGVAGVAGVGPRKPPPGMNYVGFQSL